MFRNDASKKKSRAKTIIAVFVAGMAVIAVFLYRYDRNIENAFSSDTATDTATGGQYWKSFEEDQKTVTLAAISGRPVSGTVTLRPDYVSEMEWQVLQNVVRQQPDDSKQKLTNMVNRLLFNKKREAWLSSFQNTDQRRELARQLLEMIPQQLEIEAMDYQEARELESQLSADLR